MANILIVDDEENIRDSFQFHFRSIGWHVELARDGQEAVEILIEKGRFFDGIVLDKNMPRKTGDQVVKWLYENELLEDICVVLLTGYPDMTSAIDDLRMGVWQYLIKDMTPSELQTFITPGIAMKKVHRIRRELRAAEDLEVVLDKIEAVVLDTLAPDLFHVIFLSPFLARDLSDGSRPNAERKFVIDMLRGRGFLWAQTSAEVARLEPVLVGAGTLMAVTVDHDHSVFGVLEMESMREGAFDPRWKEVLMYLSELITLCQEIHERRAQQQSLVEEQAKSTTLALMSGELKHRISTSLSIIQQSARELRAPRSDEIKLRQIQFIDSHANRIYNVLLELQDLSTERPVRQEIFDLTNEVRDAVDEWTNRSDDVTISVDAPDTILALGDAYQLHDVMSCLMKNALESIEERRPREEGDANTIHYWVRVSVGGSENEAFICVADNGRGFDDQIKARLFNPLFTTKKRRDTLNEGYGLYTSERIVKAMGGTIEGSSDGPYYGAEFTIRLRKAE